MRERVIAREIFDLLAAFTLGSDIGSDTPETDPFAIVVEHRRARHFPPPHFAFHQGFDDEVGKALLAFQSVGKLVQAGRKLTGFPAIARNQLQERFAFDFGHVPIKRKSQARADRAQFALGIDLPQPVCLPIFELAQEHGDGFAFLLHFQFGSPRSETDPCRLDHAKAADHRANRDDYGNSEIHDRYSSDQRTGSESERKGHGGEWGAIAADDADHQHEGQHGPHFGNQGCAACQSESDHPAGPDSALEKPRPSDPADLFGPDQAFVGITQAAFEIVAIAHRKREAGTPDRQHERRHRSTANDRQHGCCQCVACDAYTCPPCDERVLTSMQPSEILAIRHVQPKGLPPTQRSVLKGRIVFFLAHAHVRRRERLFPGKFGLSLIRDQAVGATRLTHSTVTDFARLRG